MSLDKAKHLKNFKFHRLLMIPQLVLLTSAITSGEMLVILVVLLCSMVVYHNMGEAKNLFINTRNSNET